MPVRVFPDSVEVGYRTANGDGPGSGQATPGTIRTGAAVTRSAPTTGWDLVASINQVIKASRCP
jgi:hypothetical protein